MAAAHSLPHHCALSWERETRRWANSRRNHPRGTEGKVGCIMIGLVV